MKEQICYCQKNILLNNNKSCVCALHISTRCARRSQLELVTEPIGTSHRGRVRKWLRYEESQRKRQQERKIARVSQREKETDDSESNEENQNAILRGNEENETENRNHFIKKKLDWNETKRTIQRFIQLDERQHEENSRAWSAIYVGVCVKRTQPGCFVFAIVISVASSTRSAFFFHSVHFLNRLLLSVLLFFSRLFRFCSIHIRYYTLCSELFSVLFVPCCFGLIPALICIKYIKMYVLIRFVYKLKTNFISLNIFVVAALCVVVMVRLSFCRCFFVCCFIILLDCRIPRFIACIAYKQKVKTTKKLTNKMKETTQNEVHAFNVNVFFFSFTAFQTIFIGAIFE